MGGIATVLGVGAVALLITSVVPRRGTGTPPALWLLVGMSRAFLWCSGTRLEGSRLDAVRRHRGLVFFNHVSWLDIVVLLAVAPVRFLAAAGVRDLPVIGWMARAVGTVFVDRADPASRTAARSGVSDALAASAVPVALSPEGGVQDGPGLSPFRHGAFEVARDAQAPVLLCAIQYEPMGYAGWLDDEPLPNALWRLCARTTPFVARVDALPDPIVPSNPIPDAELASHRLSSVLGVTPRRPAR